MNNTPANVLAEPRRWTGLKLITINLPQSYLNDLDELVGEDLYPNRAEVIRTAVRDLLAEEVWNKRRRREDM
jgi:Arc/MetJ-type ribon-helix-helix transcriptional regulator